MSGGLQIKRPDSIHVRVLWAALSEHESNTDVGRDVQDSFIVDALRAMSFEPFEHPALHPENWIKLNAGLDINARLTGRGSLELTASPWSERAHAQHGRWSFDDFVEFSGKSNLRNRPTVTVFELEFDELAAELRDPNMTIDSAAARKRKLVFRSYEHVLSRLARHFDVRVQTALVCIGRDARLLLRKMTLPDNPVEQANLSTGAQEVRWHGRYLALCKEVSVAPDELLTFFNASLLSLNEKDRRGVLRQFLGKPRESGYRSRVDAPESDHISNLFQALTVVATPKAFPPLVGHPTRDIEAYLRTLVEGSPHDGVTAIARHYCLEMEEVHQLLREHYPLLLVQAFSSPARLRTELEYFMAEQPGQVSIIDALRQRLFDALQNAWEARSSSTPGVQRRRLGDACGLVSFAALQEWAERNSPGLTPWLQSLLQVKSVAHKGPASGK